MSFQFNFTVEKLAACLPGFPDPHKLYKALCDVLPRYDITTIQRVSAFLAQCGHESNDFTSLEENLMYTANRLCQVWPSLFPTLESAMPYDRNPTAIANKVYGNRMGNGPESSGEGWLYRGRGAIQLTGKTNYTLFANYIKRTLQETVEYTSTLQGAIESAAFFWHKNNLNNIADSNNNVLLTERINGGRNGLEDRNHHYYKNIKILSGEIIAPAIPDISDLSNWPTLQIGSPHKRWVSIMQERLGIKADGNFGPGTEAALKKWQAEHGLVSDGVAGKNTIKRLFE